MISMKFQKLFSKGYIDYYEFGIEKKSMKVNTVWTIKVMNNLF